MKMVKKMESPILSSQPKTFRENTISDLDVYIEDGGVTSVEHLE